jgi:hypothetical protein
MINPVKTRNREQDVCDCQFITYDAKLDREECLRFPIFEVPAA